jgi:hypothetical protein
MKKLIRFVLLYNVAVAIWCLLEWAFLDRCFPKTSVFNWIIRIILAVALPLVAGIIAKYLIAFIRDKKVEKQENTSGTGE